MDIKIQIQELPLSEQRELYKWMEGLILSKVFKRGIKENYEILVHSMERASGISRGEMESRTRRMPIPWMRYLIALKLREMNYTSGQIGMVMNLSRSVITIGTNKVRYYLSKPSQYEDLISLYKSFNDELLKEEML